MSMRKIFAVLVMACILITGCGSAKAEQTAPAQADTAEQAAPAQADTAEQAAPAQADTTEQAVPAQADTAEQATPAQADTAEQATLAETVEQAADETDTVCITFSDTDEVLKCRRLDGDTYSCSTSTHTFKMRGFGTVEEGRYKYEDLPAEWQMMITKAREHDNW